jgi:hypothetical protein
MKSEADRIHWLANRDADWDILLIIVLFRVHFD